jgi:hypothetical protein
LGTESASLGPAVGRTARSRIASGPLALAALGLLIAVTPTFAPAAFGGTDTRQLGAQIAFSLERRPTG